MKVLFVYRGYGKDGVNSVIDFQRKSLIKSGVDVDIFPIKGGGMTYITSIFALRKHLKKRPADIIHAHYSFSGFMAAMATRKPILCSLMGSDVFQLGFVLKAVTKFFYKFMWRETIVKNKDMQKHFPKSRVIPNGVDFSNFRPIPKEEAIAKTGFMPERKNIIFVAEDPKSTVKNLQLARKAVQLLNDDNHRLHLISGKSYTELPYYYNAADMLILTSLTEGSPNVIKEAMACNCPIVVTDVGDVREVIGTTEGCYITTFEPQDVANKIQSALAFGKRTNGRESISRLDSLQIAERITSVYQICQTQKKLNEYLDKK